ncbi:hypothetical protein CANCADRAFT_140437 [Tortispora caseinolytica NRRL Y-17796]|uniref:3-hydroxyisobutyrate dehydrogenase n=1 Tax=Tortispora caseinolytica NRRL Y-17796 TaxID=767744 RepID=A0A1E4TCW6_9ASCO|nr:hypothetical protein CANCADRAFT_140437 [Tortispora caseinolytica NRRL Y-17796]
MRLLTINLSGLCKTSLQRSFSTTNFANKSYGFIGLGNMGYPMASNLHKSLKPEDSLVVFDVVEGRLQQFLKEHPEKVSAATNVSEVAEKSDTVVTMLPEPEHVRNVFEEIQKSNVKTTTFVDCSTIDAQTTKDIATMVKQKLGGSFWDAPVSGGTVGAKNGTLTFMVGCPSDEFVQAEKLLKTMGGRIINCGATGTGIAAKLANNYALAIHNIATAEAMNLGIRLGLDKNVLASILNTSTGRCWPSEVNNPVPGVIETAPASRDYQGGFGISLMRKDLGLALEAAKTSESKLTLGEDAYKVYKAAEKEPDCAGRDFSVVYRWLGGKE